MRTAERAGSGPRANERRGIHLAIAWSGSLLFFASLSYFLYSYAVTWGVSAAFPPQDERGFGGARATAINIVLFTTFALHHSIFARHRVRAWVARVVPPHLERSCYVWIASLLFIAVCFLWQPVPGMAWRAEGPWQWVAFATQAMGIWLTLHSAMIIDVFELSGIRQLSPQPGPMVFKTSGPYGWVRHPIYSGWFLLVFGAPTMTMTRLVFAAVSSVYLLIAIPFEERSIRTASGGAYDAYAKQVRWKVIPGVY
jgi:protein-S-isoprenylcysteine O-methyltransferase Ste14